MKDGRHSGKESLKITHVVNCTYINMEFPKNSQNYFSRIKHTLAKIREQNNISLTFPTRGEVLQ